MNHFYLNYISNASVSWTDIATGVSAEFFLILFHAFTIMRDMETEWSTLCKNLRGDSLAVSPCYSNILSWKLSMTRDKVISKEETSS